MCRFQYLSAHGGAWGKTGRLTRWIAWAALVTVVLAPFSCALGAMVAETPEKAAAADQFAEEFWDEEAFGEAFLPPEPPLMATLNRLMFHFNDTFYFGVMKPVAGAYEALVPLALRKGFGNFFRNLGGPIRFLNALLQGKGEVAEAELVRFAMNTTVGAAGFGNPAGRFEHLNPPAEDLGQTLGVYGFGEGVFLIWPVLGPSTLRDSVGMVGDGMLHPLSVSRPPGAFMGFEGA